MNLLIVSDNFVNLSVFESQIHSLANLHCEHGVNVKLIALCRLNEYAKMGKEDANYTLYKSIKFPKAYSLLINSIMALLFQRKEIFEWADVIHSRNIIGTSFALKVLKKYKIDKPVIADIRGETVEEIRSQNKLLSSLFASLARKMERFLFRRADFFFFVSQNMKEYYSNMYALSDHKSAVFPTIVDERNFYKSESHRSAIRQKLSYSETDFVYVYVGGCEYWQNIDKIILRFDEVCQNILGLHLLIITKNIDEIERITTNKKIKNDRIQWFSLPYKEVGQYLNACDAGIIIRDNSLINFVASPTKTNEYLACGLKILDDLKQIGNRSFTSTKYNYRDTNSIIQEQEKIFDLLSMKISK